MSRELIKDREEGQDLLGVESDKGERERSNTRT